MGPLATIPISTRSGSILSQRKSSVAHVIQVHHDMQPIGHNGANWVLPGKLHFIEPRRLDIRSHLLVQLRRLGAKTVRTSATRNPSGNGWGSMHFNRQTNHAVTNHRFWVRVLCNWKRVQRVGLGRVLVADAFFSEISFFFPTAPSDCRSCLIGPEAPEYPSTHHDHCNPTGRACCSVNSIGFGYSSSSSVSNALARSC
jgi:hypothetical protein